MCLEGEFENVTGPLAVPVLLDPRGWTQVVDEQIADDERAALVAASLAIADAQAAAAVTP